MFHLFYIDLVVFFVSADPFDPHDALLEVDRDDLSLISSYQEAMSMIATSDYPSEPARLSEDEIAEMRLRCEQATPGPWKSYVEGRQEMSGSDFIATGAEDIYLTGATTADQDFIAHARVDIPRLIS
jgi:hypothetical protein